MEEDHKAEPMPLHFIEADTEVRAGLRRVATSLGHPCKMYADLSEVYSDPPRSGCIFVRDISDLGGVVTVSDRLMELGVWLPLVAMDEAPAPLKIVQAVKGGALDYLTLPLHRDCLAACLARIGGEVAMISENRRLYILAKRKLEVLSPREREVLDALAHGRTNKDIACQLQISPRTVEHHRANMMAKLGVRHFSDAIRIRVEWEMRAISIRLRRAALTEPHHGIAAAFQYVSS